MNSFTTTQLTSEVFGKTYFFKFQSQIRLCYFHHDCWDVTFHYSCWKELCLNRIQMMYNDFYESCARESCIQMRAKYNSLLSGFYFRLQMWNDNSFFLYIECENDFFILKLIMKNTQKLKVTNHDLCKDIIQDLVLKRHKDR